MFPYAVQLTMRSACACRQGLGPLALQGWAQIMLRQRSGLASPAASPAFGEYLHREGPRKVGVVLDGSSLDQDPADTAFEPDASGVADICDRQNAGEIADDLDPAFLLLVISSAVISGAVFPVESKRTLGLDPGSPEYISHMSGQLRRLIRRLANPPPS